MKYKAKVLDIKELEDFGIEHDNGFIEGYLVKSNFGETGPRDKYTLIFTGESGYGLDTGCHFEHFKVDPKTVEKIEK